MGRSRLVLAGTLLVVLGLARLASVVLHDPVAGFANQYDMLRLGACVGLYPDLPEPQRYERTPEAPIARYVLAAPRPADCHYSSELVFVESALLAQRLAHGGSSEAASVDLRWIGSVKLAFAAAMVGAIALLLRRHPLASFVHGLIVFLVLADPLVALWFNTLYSETALLLGAYLSIALIVVVFLRERAGPLLWGAIVVAMLLLGLSKEQFFALPLMLLAIAAPALWRAGRTGFAAAGIAALLPVVLAVFPPPGNEVPYRAHRLDTYLGALVASSRSPDDTRRRLHLPQRCEALVGTTYLRPRGEDPDVECPEVYALSSLAFVALLGSEPGTLATALARGLASSQNAFTSLGVVAGAKHARVEALEPWIVSAWAPLFSRVPVAVYAMVVVSMIVLSLTTLAVAAVAEARILEGAALGFLLGLLGACYAYALASAVLGDGFDDVAKHVVLGSVCLAAWLVAAAVTVCVAVAGPIASLGVRGALVAALAIGAGADVVAWRWLRDQPLAFGVIDEPAGRRAARAALTVRGWALDPFGVRSVEAEVAGQRVTGTFGMPVPGLALHFPAYPDGELAGYSIAIPPQALGGDAAELRVFATNARGARVEIDRRRLTLF